MADLFQPSFVNPPQFTTVAPGQGGGANALGGSGLLSGLLSGGGQMFGGLLSGGLLSGGLSPTSSATATGGPVAATGWGTFNNPFVISTGSSKADSSNSQTAPTSMDLRQTGPEVKQAGASAPFMQGDVPFMAIAALIVLGAVAIKAATRKAA